MNPSIPSLAALTLIVSPAFAETDVATLIDRGYYREADSRLAAAVAATPNDPTTLACLAKVRAEQGRLDEAQKLAEKAVEAGPNLATTHFALAEVCGERAGKASILKVPGFARRFKKEVDATLAIDPKNVDALGALVQFHLQAPGIVGGDKKKIPALLDQISAIDPAQGCMARSEMAFRDKDSTQAVSWMLKAVDAEKNGADAHMALARHLSAPWRNPGKSEELAREALAREPWRQDAWALIVALAARAGRIEEMNETLAKAEAADPTRLGAYYTAGRQLLIDGKDLDRAEQCFRHYLTREPEFGWPGHGGAHWRLGQILEKRGDRQGAIAEIETALKLQPELDDAKKDLKRLKG